jgi:hypothetical protein
MKMRKVVLGIGLLLAALVHSHGPAQVTDYKYMFLTYYTPEHHGETDFFSALATGVQTHSMTIAVNKRVCEELRTAAEVHYANAPEVAVTSGCVVAAQ